MNPFTGVIAVENCLTADRRRIRLGGLRFSRKPIPVIRHLVLDGFIGSVTRVYRDGSIIRAVGVVRLNPGVYPCGVDLGSARMTYDDESAWYTVNSGKILGLTVGDSDTYVAAWPEAQITVTGSIMGFILDSTPDMGNFSAEARRESFYFSSPDLITYHSIDAHPLSRVSEKALDAILYIVDGVMLREDNAVVLHAYTQLKEELKRAREYEKDIRNYVHRNDVSQELAYADIPALRATLDAVEAYVREPSGI